MNEKAATPQPDPVPGRQAIGELVLADVQARIEMGIEKHGMPLQTHNGRDAMWDAYQEAIDLCMYLRQAIAERDEHSRLIAIAPKLLAAIRDVVITETAEPGPAIHLTDIWVTTDKEKMHRLVKILNYLDGIGGEL